MNQQTKEEIEIKKKLEQLGYVIYFSDNQYIISYLRKSGYSTPVLSGYRILPEQEKWNLTLRENYKIILDNEKR